MQLLYQNLYIYYLYLYIESVNEMGWTLSFVFTDVTPKYTSTHNTTAFAILVTNQ